MVRLNYPLPENEAARLQALRDLDIIGSPPEPEFDAITEVLRAIFDAPVAVISFMEADHQWFKARCGLDVETTDRSEAFCTHTILGRERLVVPDASKDKRFADSALVTGPPHVKFYAGHPISLDGRHNIGTVCVVDSKPRQPTAQQLDQLDRLARVTNGLLQTYRTTVKNREAALRTKLQNEELAAQHRLLKQIERMAEVGAFRVDLDTGETSWSDHVFRLHDLPIGNSPSLDEALDYFPAGEKERVVDHFQKDFDKGRPTLVEADFITALGRKRRVRFAGELQVNEDGKRTALGVIQDVTRQYQDAQSLWRAAHIDSLSGLANRQWFQQRLNALLKEIHGSAGGLALILIDLDGFKLVNDSLGHAAGDKVIQVMADRMQEAAGKDGFCARLAGDEFAILLKTSATMRDTVDELRATADALIDSLKTPVSYAGERLYIGASIGIARAPHDAERAEGLLKCADMALYKAKRTGRGRAMFYHEGLKTIFRTRRAAVDMVRDAFLADRIEAHYQPIIDMRTKVRLGAEALVRIRMPDGTLYGPDDFKQAFEDPESARSIDKRVSSAVMEHLKSWSDEGVDPGIICMNISNYWFQTEEFAAQTMKALETAGVDPRLIRFEIGESTLLSEDRDAVRRELNLLCEAGVSVALDDFGAGFASLTHLRDFPIDTIKIDRSFVRGLGHHEPSTLIVKAIIDLAHSLDVNVVATGVESDHEAEYLRDLGCYQAQGALFGSAVAPGVLASALRAAGNG